MANTLTGLIQFIDDTIDVVSNEPTGMIGAVSQDNKAEMAALNQDISYSITAVATPRAVVPAAVAPTLVDETVTAGTMALTKSYGVPFYWTGDDEARLTSGTKTAINNNKFAQAFRAIRNLIEIDLAALQSSASRAYAAHATTPAALFGSNFGEIAEVNRILIDNGAPPDQSLVIGTKPGAALRTLIGPTAVQGSSILQNGILMDMYGTKIRESAAIVSTTSVGNNTGGYVLNGAHAKGATALTIKTGSGTILAGDVITIGTDTATKYVVVTGVNNGTTITIAAPGLTKAALADAAVAIVGVCQRNMLFSRSAIQLLTRLPMQPAGGDSATAETIVVDPISGIPFRVAEYKGYHASQFEISCAWGVKATKTEHIALLLGN